MGLFEKSRTGSPLGKMSYSLNIVGVALKKQMIQLIDFFLLSVRIGHSMEN